MSNKNPPSYPEIIKEIMEPLFEKNNYPILADYEEAVAEWMNDFYEFGENDSKRYKKRDFHSQVQKHVSAMLDKELVKYDDKYIIPNTIIIQIITVIQYILTKSDDIIIAIFSFFSILISNDFYCNGRNDVIAINITDISFNFCFNFFR